MVRLNFTVSKMDLILEDYQSSDDDVEVIEPVPVPEIQVPEIPVPEPIVIEDVNMTRTSTFT